MQNAIETTATIGANRNLILDEELPGHISRRVRVIVLLDDFDDKLWLNAVSTNEVFGFLADEAEDIYTLEDGVPIADEA